MTAWFTSMVEMIEELVLYNTCLLISCQLPQCLAEGVLKKKIGFTLLQYRGRVDRYLGRVDHYLGQSGSLPGAEWITTWGRVDHYLGQVDHYLGHRESNRGVVSQTLDSK